MGTCGFVVEQDGTTSLADRMRPLLEAGEREDYPSERLLSDAAAPGFGAAAVESLFADDSAVRFIFAAMFANCCS